MASTAVIRVGKCCLAIASGSCPLIGTAKLNSVDPEAYLHEVLGCIAEHPINKLDKLLPWNFARRSSGHVSR